MKRALLRFYAEYETYLTPLFKFAAAFVLLLAIGRLSADQSLFGRIPVILIGAALCSFLPPGALILAGSVWLCGQFFAHSMVTLVVGGVVLFVFLLLYLCFGFHHPYVTAFTALGVGIRLPLVVPVVCALLLGADALPGILLGTGILFFSRGLLMQSPGGELAAEELLEQVLEGFRTLSVSPELLLTLVSLTAVFLVVWMIRRMSVNYCWVIAIAAGIFSYGALMILGAVLLQTEFVPLRFAFDVLLALAGGFLVLFFCFHLDYRKVEHLQFEDDEYYYYVKAVAKAGTETESGKGDEER